MYRKFLIPIDDSEASFLAAQHGLDLARALHAAVVLVTVVKADGTGLAFPPPAGGYGSQADLYPEEPDLEGRLRLLKRRAERLGVSMRLVVHQGAPIAEILAAAEAERPDLILMAGHGRGRVASLVWGSVTQALIAEARCPVQVLGQAALQSWQLTNQEAVRQAAAAG